MLRTTIAVLIAVASATACAWLILTNAYPDEGPYISVSASHGVHVGDVLVVAAWAVLVLLLVRWSARTGGRPIPPKSIQNRAGRPPDDR